MPDRRLDEEEIFHVARKIADPETQATYLDQVCAGDQPLRDRVGALLKVHEQEQAFLASESPDPPPTAEVTSSIERPGATIGRYRLMEQIGEGGMGIVFVAEQETPIRRKVALKVIKPGMDSRTVIARFESERQALAMMDHVNIARVLDAGTTDAGRPYFVMELVHGIPITDYCDRNKLTVQERLELFIQVCQAIQHAHQKGIIHRDIKPTNVLVTLHDGKPVPKVIDFGVAKALHQRLTERTVYTSFAQVVGTPLYMSPEQAELSGLDIDTRSDVYSLGVLLYELLTGTTPFDKKQFEKAAYDEIRRIIRETDPPKPSTKIGSLGETSTSVSLLRGTDQRTLSRLVTGDLDIIAMKALEKDRTRRYDTASGMAADIERFLNDEPIVARSPSVGYRFVKFARRNRAVVVTSAVVLTSLLLGIITATTLATQLHIEVEEKNGAMQELKTANRALEQKTQHIADLYFRQILVDVMSGNDVRANQVISEVDQAKILSAAEIDFLNGQRNLYGGNTDEAIKCFKRSIERNGDWVLPRAALVMAYILGGGSTTEPLLEDAERLAQGRQLSPLEQMFLEYPKAILWTSSSSVDALTALAETERTPLASVFLADALIHKANDEGDWAAIAKALDLTARVRSYLPNNAYVLTEALWAHCVAINLADNAQVRDTLTKDGKELAKQLEAFPRYPVAVDTRAGFYNQIDDMDNLLALTDENSLCDPLAAFLIGAGMYRQGDVSAAKELSARIQPHDDVFLLMGKAWTMAFSEHSDPEICAIYSALKGHNFKWFTFEAVLLMQRDAAFRQQQCREQIALGKVQGWDRALLDYIADDRVDTESRDKLVALAKEQTHARRLLSRAYTVIALKYLLHGNRQEGQRYLEECRDLGYFIESEWARAYLQRLEGDPAWPDSSS